MTALTDLYQEVILDHNRTPRNYRTVEGATHSGLGHNPDTFWNPALLEHFLAGIQFALGDLQADAEPSVKPPT